MRLDKFLVDCGVGSRSQVKTCLKKKQGISRFFQLVAWILILMVFFY